MADSAQVRVQRWGKSLPATSRGVGSVNPGGKQGRSRQDRAVLRPCRLHRDHGTQLGKGGFGGGVPLEGDGNITPR